MNQSVISLEEFKKRLAQLCISSKTSDLPRRQRDRHILLKSLSLSIEQDRSYTEVEINGQIEKWLSEVGRSLEIDHVTLRRTLVDEGYLSRSFPGDSYRLEHSFDRQIHFAVEVDATDSRLVVLQAAEEIFRRRQHYKKQNE